MLARLRRHFTFTAIALLLISCTSRDRPNAQTNTTTPPVADSTQAVPVATPKPISLLTPENPDPQTQPQIQQYRDRLSSLGFDPQQQGIWLQTDDTLLANIQGTQRFPAASVTKIATTLAALRQFGIDRRFSTEFLTTGQLQDGVLNGDLIVVGGANPLFIWEEAILVANRLNDLGIDRVTGDLLITGTFYMNFEEDVQLSGQLLQQAFDSNRWSPEAENQYRTLPPDTPRPQLDIAGTVRLISESPANAEPQLRHQSVPLPELLKLMNRYSNNAMSHTLANAMGGAEVVVREVLDATGVPAEELQLSNGSGLGRENQMSPRTAVQMYRAINRELAPYDLTVADVVAVAGEPEGILTVRPLPPQAVVKSGSINAVSTISGGIPTQERGVVWFAIFNGGEDTDALRAEQERLLSEIEARWGATEGLPPSLSPNPQRRSQTSQIEVLQRQ